MNSISTIVNKKIIIDYVVEEEESVSQKNIEKVDLEIIRELEELYNDDDDEIEEELI